MTSYPLHIGCTAERHKRIGIHAVINARAGLQQLNNLTDEDIELRRDAHKIADWQSRRARFYQFNSRFCRRHLSRLTHLLSSYEED